jgi:hypothetical protein
MMVSANWSLTNFVLIYPLTDPSPPFTDFWLKTASF